MARFTPEQAGTMSFPKAMLTGGGMVLAGLAVAMLLPIAYDIYRVTKNWLLQEQQPPIP